MNTHNKIKTIIYRLLAQREYSSVKIAQKLANQGFQATDLRQVIEELRQEGSINDQRFIESYIHHRQNQGLGPLRIRQELLAEGLSKEMIEDQLKIADNAWFAEAQRVWQKRFHGTLPSTLKERGKQFRFLQYRGFTQEQIESLFDQ